MGHCKFKIGRHHKNYERKRQALKKSKIGQPRRAGNPPRSFEALPTHSPPHADNQISLATVKIFRNIHFVIGFFEKYPLEPLISTRLDS